MAEVDIAPQFGLELKDGFKSANNWVSNGISWLDDIQAFYRERSAIEKEYSAKLNALAKKYYEKKTKKSSSLSVGDTPAMTPGSLESASLTTWTTQLTTLESRAAEHDRFGRELITQVAEPLKVLGGRYEEIRKRHVEYAEKLEKERDSTYADLRKMKGNLQDLFESRTIKLNGIWSLAAQLETGMLERSAEFLGHLSRGDTKKPACFRLYDQIREGNDKRDEVEVVRAIFALQEELHQVDHKRLTAEVETSTITEAVGDVTLGSKSHNFKSQTFKIPTNCDLCGERIWGLSAKGFDCRDCGYTCHSKCEMKVPAECPGEQTKDEKKKLKAERQEAANAIKAPGTGLADSVAELPTMSRSNTMNSLSSGYAASANRSLSTKSPAEETPPETAVGRTRSISSSLKPGILKKHRVVAPPPTAYISELPGSVPNESASNEQRGKMLYAYDANGSEEVTVAEGTEVTILEPDDGGWTKIKSRLQRRLSPNRLPRDPPFILLPSSHE
ncbi:hypothetical protein DID88_003221 [Monilinia fructigena]|uniref:Uncharacterized protein n=1 Tax=Monilinia fructigena TaxID=38457 RepID=A0A395IX78_9HELO|nr:hypothetical protein DID88_003221 [Monilinia fructigena]